MEYIYIYISLTQPQPPWSYAGSVAHSPLNHQAQDNVNRPLPVMRPEGWQGMFVLIMIIHIMNLRFGGYGSLHPTLSTIVNKLYTASL